MPEERTRSAVRRFLEAVGTADPDAVAAACTARISYANMPHPPAIGRDALRAMFAPILERSERVRWDLVTAAYGTDRAWLERVDRFWIDGAEYAIECNGVFEVDPDSGLICAVRDYVDLATWRSRLGGVLERR